MPTRHPNRRSLATGLAVVIASPALATAAPARPRRIVSLTPCLDAILVQVADRSQVRALSHWSRDASSSSIAQLARTYPFTYETAEEVVSLRPDLVLNGRLSPPAMQGSLDRLGIRMELFDVPETVEASLEQVRRIAWLAGHPERGAALAGRIEAAITAAEPAPWERPLTALVFQSNGFASAEGTLVDAMLRRTGFVNAAARYGLKRTSDVPLERLLADPPDVLLSSTPGPGVPSWADRVLLHPALRAVGARMYRADFPQRLMNCGGPVLIEAAAKLAQARRAALSRPA